MTMIDNALGLGINMANSTNGSTNLILNDNYIYGESEIPDCPDSNNKNDYCEITSKYGVYPGIITSGSQKVMRTDSSHLPAFKNMADSVNTKGRNIWNRNKFFYFKGKTLLN